MCSMSSSSTSFDMSEHNNSMNAFKASFNVLLKADKLPHAIIIEGDNAQTLEAAKLLSCALVCEGAGEKPCFECSACLKAMADTGGQTSAHPDILVYSGGDKPRSFPVDKIREIRSSAYIIPNEAQKKVFVLLKAQSMGVEAQNALLKILEEPPNFVVFILTCQSRSQLLETILSRCVCYLLNAVDYVQEDEEILKLCDGIARAAACESEFELLALTGAFEKNTDKLKRTVSQLISVISDALKIHSGSKAVLYSRQNETAVFLASNFTAARLIALIEALENINQAVKYNANNNLLITMLCADIRRAAGK